MLDFIPAIPSPYFEIFLLPLALWLLFFSSKVLIECALTIGEKLNLSELFIGLTLIAWVTSLPEIFVMIKKQISIVDIKLRRRQLKQIRNIFQVCQLFHRHQKPHQHLIHIVSSHMWFIFI